MQDFFHLVLIEENIGTTIIRNQETVTIRMPLNPPCGQTRPLWQHVGPFAVSHQLPFTLHRTQATLEHLALALCDIQQRHQLAKLNRASFISQNLGNIFAGRQRKLISSQLPLKKWISAAYF